MTAAPPSRTRSNLPAQRELLIGRERERAALGELLARESVGLVTLVGPGGVGKTRLALQVAADVCDLFPDGVWFVPLAPVNTPDLVVSTITRALGLEESGGQPLLTSLQVHLREKQLLLGALTHDELAAARAGAASMGLGGEVVDALAQLCEDEEALRARRIKLLYSTVGSAFRFAHEDEGQIRGRTADLTQILAAAREGAGLSTTQSEAP